MKWHADRSTCSQEPDWEVLSTADPRCKWLQTSELALMALALLLMPKLRELQSSTFSSPLRTLRVLPFYHVRCIRVYSLHGHLTESCLQSNLRSLASCSLVSRRIRSDVCTVAWRIPTYPILRSKASLKAVTIYGTRARCSQKFIASIRTPELCEACVSIFSM